MDRSTRLEGLLGRVIDLRPGEAAAAALSFLYFFALLASYYVLRPLRDEMGIAGGVENLPWLFTGTFLAMLAAVPVFGAVVARVPRRRFVPWVYRFFAVNILLFFLLLSADDGVVRMWTARAFFIWVSLFNLFVVSVFWSFMADLFSNAQGRRLFGFIAAGGSAGALLGPTLTASLAGPLGPVNLLLIAALLLEAAVQCIRALLRRVPEGADGPATAAPIGGSLWAGLIELARSPYLLGIGLYIVFYTMSSTFLYFQQAEIIAGAFDDPAERTRVFAVIDLLVGLLTLGVQVGLTGRLMRRFGVGPMLAFLPALTAIGFAILALAPSVAALIGFQALRRAGNFAISRPARELLFTVVTPEQKYKAKNAIDTLVYRGGDAVSGWLYAGLGGLGMALPAIAGAFVPVAALWWLLAVGLGRAQDRRA